MSNIESYIKSRTKHFAVYWGVSGRAADGSNTYDDPVEIKCFWEGSSFLTLEKANDLSMRANVHVNEDLDEQGVLFYGRLGDLTTEQQANPKLVSRAYVIRRFVKTPSLQTKNKFNRVAMIWYGNKGG